MSMQSRSSLAEHVHLDGFQSRSQSRARPHRHFSLDVKGEKVSVPSRAHSPSRFAARFASAAPSRVHSRSERHDSETVHTSKDDAEYYVNLKDPRGHELDPNSRIWHIYNAESRKHDARMMEGWNRSMDVLLVFTGLFSAVLTTFIIQTYQMMIPDETDTLLSQLVNDSASRTLSSSSSSSAPATHWVNGLWFAALACSLSTALISMLAKQWLQAYIPHISGAARQKARIRQSRYMQLDAWHIPAIINTLPILVHVALLLFFAGLIVLLWPADLAITIATWRDRGIGISVLLHVRLAAAFLQGLSLLSSSH
ncbi:hypothetical protein BDZ89DRAFT_1144422 [Hymenopellis radicata]|nr:hypothetical protein BDZ89DRAFT_1144422 [Hymenopellis radicata]